MFVRTTLGVLLVSAAACATPVDIDWGASSPTPTPSPTPSDGGLPTWLAVRPLLLDTPNAASGQIEASWSPVSGVTSWDVYVDGAVVETTALTSYAFNAATGSQPTVWVLPSALVSTGSEVVLSLSSRPVNRAGIPPWGRRPGAELSIAAPNTCFGKSLTAVSIDSDATTDLLVGAPWNGNGSLIPYISNGGGSFTIGSAVSSSKPAARYGYAQALVSAPPPAVPRVMVGAPGADAAAGEIVEWTPLTSIGTPLANGFAGSSFFGAALASADLNGNQLPELLVGAPGAMGNDGAIVLYTQTNVSAWSAPAMVDGTNGEQLGTSVALAVDMIGNNDYALAGAPYYLMTQGRTRIRPADATPALGSPSDTFGAVDLFLGTSVLAPGDINGDMFSDVITGLPGYVSGAGSRFRVISGASANLGAQINAAVTQDAPALASASRFGETLFSVGDVTFDGVRDFAVGAPQHPNAGLSVSNAGVLVLYAGTAPYEPIWSYEGREANTFFGVSAAKGDFDGDSHPDLAVGAANCLVGGGTSGAHEAVHLFFSPPASGATVVPGFDTFEGQTGVAVNFDPAIGDLGIGNLAECAWDWGDELVDPEVPCESVSFGHTYALAGTYQPVLTVHSYGMRTQITFRVIVE